MMGKKFYLLSPCPPPECFKVPIFSLVSHIWWIGEKPRIILTVAIA